MKGRLALLFALLPAGSDPAQMLVRLALRQALVGCENVLDVGCGSSTILRQMGTPNLTGIDGYLPEIETARRLKTHDHLVHGDVCNLLAHFQPKQFDACVALDLIEHLQKPEGLQLLQNMETIARKKVLIFTPSGFLPQGHTDAGDLQSHWSGWEPDEMRAAGYEVIGLLGPKSMRGEYHALKHRPRFAAGLISMLAHFIWTRWHPEKAAAILCVKSL